VFEILFRNATTRRRTASDVTRNGMNAPIQYPYNGLSQRRAGGTPSLDPRQSERQALSVPMLSSTRRVASTGWGFDPTQAPTGVDGDLHLQALSMLQRREDSVWSSSFPEC
jgi:hypothetical protein